MVDSFVNSVVLYDDRIEFFFNYKDGAKTLTMEELSKSSDLLNSAPPKNRVRITYSVFSWKKEGGFEGDCAEHSEAKTSQCDVFKESGKRAVSHLTHRKWRVGSFVKQKRNLLPPIFI